MFEDDSKQTMAHNEHDHGNGHGTAALSAETMPEVPLDAANQSLADALRSSFWILKAVMLIVLVCYLCSGFFVVDQTQVAVQLRFGQPTGQPKRPGAHWGLPYPIDEVVRVSTAPKTLKIDDFWLNLRPEDKTKNLADVSARSNGLDPAMDGALITADKAIMHAQFEVVYFVPEKWANEFVSKVQDDEALVRSVVKQAIIAEAARTSAESILTRKREVGAPELAELVQLRAQSQLEDVLQCGIQIKSIIVPRSHYPLQTKDQFLAVDTAANLKTALINEAQTQQQKTLNGVAGPAWMEINQAIEKLDQVKNNEEERRAIIEDIGKLLTNAPGDAGGKIKLAQRDREKIVSDVMTEQTRFLALADAYKKNPELVRTQLGHVMREDVLDNPGVSKWILPPGQNSVTLWMSLDPKELAEREKQRIENMKKKGQ